jgi:hypothetical protein
MCLLELGGKNRIGGAEGNRTHDLLNAIQALSQLSYGPTVWLRLSQGAFLIIGDAKREVNGPNCLTKNLNETDSLPHLKI